MRSLSVALFWIDSCDITAIINVGDGVFKRCGKHDMANPC